MTICPLARSNLSTTSYQHIQEWWNETMSLIIAFHNSAYQVTSYVLMTAGIVGHGAGLITLMRGLSLQTSHFYFYKAMTAAELAYCCNFFVTDMLVRNFMSCGQHCVVSNWVAGFYIWQLSRFVYSFCGYVVLYMSLFICFDRCGAIWTYTQYSRVPKSQKNCISVGWTSAAVGLAMVFHSWDAFSRVIIVESIGGKANSTILYISSLRQKPGSYTQAKYVKDLYNLCIRAAYPVVLLVLTIAVIVGLLRRSRQHRNLRTVRRADRRRERKLFSLMIAVVSLAFIQVIPAEVKRIMNYVGQNSSVVICYTLALSGVLSLRETWRILMFTACLRWLQTIANITTMVDRSLKFYIYMMLNRQFRREALVVICRHKAVVLEESTRTCTATSETTSLYASLVNSTRTWLRRGRYTQCEGAVVSFGHELERLNVNYCTLAYPVTPSYSCEVEWSEQLQVGVGDFSSGPDGHRERND